MSLFTTGDGSEETVLFVTGQIVTPLWFRRSLIQAIVLMTQPGNWTEYGDANIQFATDKATELLNSLEFSEENPLPINKPYIGEIRSFAFTTPPSGWLRCDGQFLAKATYPDLFAKVQNYFGADDATHFYIPDLKSRFQLGSMDGTPNPLGDVGGQATVTLTSNQIPAHSHTGVVSPNNPVANRAVVSSGGVQTVRTAGTSDNTGGGEAHDNMPPYLSIMFAIYTGVE